MRKLKDYLWRSDFEEYFRHPNQTGSDEFVRRKLIESDFKMGYFSGYSFAVLLLVIIVIKWILLSIGEYTQSANTLWLFYQHDLVNASSIMLPNSNLRLLYSFRGQTLGSSRSPTIWLYKLWDRRWFFRCGYLVPWLRFFSLVSLVSCSKSSMQG